MLNKIYEAESYVRFFYAQGRKAKAEEALNNAYNESIGELEKYRDSLDRKKDDFFSASVACDEGKKVLESLAEELSLNVNKNTGRKA